MKNKNLTTREVISILGSNKSEMRKYGVKRIGLFGSFAKGKQKERSDLDFIVKLQTPSFDNYMELKFFLERIFKRRVDLVTEGGLKPSLQKIKKEAVYA